MKPKGRITALAQHIIDTFRALYLEKEISARKFSLVITDHSNPTRVASIENIYNNETYTPELIAKSLKYFNLTMEDILPVELLDKDELIDKTRIPILKQMSIRTSLNSLLEEGYFDIPRLRSEITSHYNSFLAENMHKVDSDISASLENLYIEGKLLKIKQGDKDEVKSDLIRFVSKTAWKQH